MQASDYKVTTGYGQIPGYPLNNGYHRGEDRAMPSRTPVFVNGYLIGYSGNTGESTGSHLHTGKFTLQGQDVNPNGEGFNLPNATVVDTGQDAVNGNWVRIRSGNFTYVYLHLDEITAVKGDRVVAPIGGKGAEEPMSTIATKDLVDSLAHAYLNDSVDSNPGLKYYIGQPIEVAITDFNKSKQRDNYLRSLASTQAAADRAAALVIENIELKQRLNLDTTQLEPAEAGLLVKIFAWFIGNKK